MEEVVVQSPSRLREVGRYGEVTPRDPTIRSPPIVSIFCNAYGVTAIYLFLHNKSIKPLYYLPRVHEAVQFEVPLLNRHSTPNRNMNHLRKY